MLNKHYQNVGIHGYLLRYGIKNAVCRAFFTTNPLHFVPDYEVKKLLWQKSSMQKLKKYMRYADSQPEGLKYPKTQVSDQPVWFYWKQGLENAPEIVKKCYESAVHYSGKEVILVSDKNLSKYLVLPAYIREKVKKGKISIAAYSDIIRFSLLEHYGGTWIDSTVLLTSELPKEIMEADFFALRNSMCLIDNPVLYAVWFLHSKPGNLIMRQIRNIELEYWKREKNVREYLMSNLFLTEIIHTAGKETEIPYMNTDYSEYMVRCLADPYDEKKFSWIKKLTGIHKLTYKLDKEIEETDTLFHYIVSR